MRPPSAMPWPSSAVNSGPRRLSPPPRITETYRNSQPTCSTAFWPSPADRPDLQSQAQAKTQKAPLLPRLFPVDCVRFLQAQFFDNSASPPKQGQSQFALKLFAWTEGTIDFQQPHWWRVVQLLEPSKVLRWATGKRDAGQMTADQFGLYQMAYEGAAGMIEDGSRAWMGPIGSPPGKHYFVGQFV